MEGPIIVTVVDIVRGIKEDAETSLVICWLQYQMIKLEIKC